MTNINNSSIEKMINAEQTGKRRLTVGENILRIEYTNSVEKGADILEFSDFSRWDDNIEALVKALKKHHVNEFIITEPKISIYALSELQELGCTLAGIQKVTRNTGRLSGAEKKGILIKVN